MYCIVRYKRYCVTKTPFIRVCIGTQRLCFRIYKIECSVNKNDLPCCCVVFFVVCQLLRPVWCDFGEFYSGVGGVNPQKRQLAGEAGKLQIFFDKNCLNNARFAKLCQKSASTPPPPHPATSFPANDHFPRIFTWRVPWRKRNNCERNISKWRRKREGLVEYINYFDAKPSTKKRSLALVAFWSIFSLIWW